MRTFLKSCFLVIAAGFLLISMQAGAADSSKEKRKPNEPLKQCRLDCKSNKDTLAYEACMIKCEETYSSKRSSDPGNKK